MNDERILEAGRRMLQAAELVQSTCGWFEEALTRDRQQRLEQLVQLDATLDKFATRMEAVAARIEEAVG